MFNVGGLLLLGSLPTPVYSFTPLGNTSVTFESNENAPHSLDLLIQWEWATEPGRTSVCPLLSLDCRFTLAFPVKYGSWNGVLKYGFPNVSIPGNASAKTAHKKWTRRFGTHNSVRIINFTTTSEVGQYYGKCAGWTTAFTILNPSDIEIWGASSCKPIPPPVAKCTALPSLEFDHGVLNEVEINGSKVNIRRSIDCTYATTVKLYISEEICRGDDNLRCKISVNNMRLSATPVVLPAKDSMDLLFTSELSRTGSVPAGDYVKSGVIVMQVD